MSTFARAACCNPFKEPNHTAVRKNLRNILPWMIKVNPLLSEGHKICDKCRKKMVKDSKVSEASTSRISPVEEIKVQSDSDHQQAEIPDYENEAAICSLNESLQSIGETPIKKKRLSERKYPKTKFKKVSKVLKEKILQFSDSDSSTESPEMEMLTQLKEKFQSTKDRSLKVQILTLLPKSWSVRKVQKEFEATNYMVRKAKKLVKENGILSTPNPKPGKNLSQDTVNSVKDFYNSDQISRNMPGKKDFVSMASQGEKIPVQKRLVLCNLNEAFKEFKDEYPHLKIGFSKFAELRPKNCILAGASGTHTVCVCHIHQNVKLMMIGSNLKELTSEENIPISSYKTCIALLLCNPAHPTCYLNECKNCPKFEEFKIYLDKLFCENSIETIEYKQWLNVDRSILQTLTNSYEEFIESFIDKLSVLIRHSFIAQQQSSFFKDTKNNLKCGEYAIVSDFSENYSFILQDEAQGFHWNNAQATIHPFVIYYNRDNHIENISFVVISDCLSHDTTAVYVFQKNLVKFLKGKFDETPLKFTYFSDGAAAHYKNRKNFLNLCCHKKDFGIPAEWHFFATAHGKGVSDGIGGTVKRLAARASLQQAYTDQIMTPRALYEWASSHISGIEFCYVTSQQYENENNFLQERFSSSCAISGTQKLHAFIPQNNNTLLCKIYSNSDAGKIVKVTKEEAEIELEEIKGYVTCIYDKEWWLACVLSVNYDTEEIKINFLHPHGPSSSFYFPEHPDVLQVTANTILTKVDPRTVTGRTYKLSEDEMHSASIKLRKKNCTTTD